MTALTVIAAWFTLSILFAIAWGEAHRDMRVD